MNLSIIVAMAKNHAIGIDNRMPWHLSADLKRFKAITMGKPILMGRKTHESIGRPLPGRKNIILTRDQAYQAEGCVVVYSLEQAFQSVQDSDELMIIGGSSLYQRFLGQAQRLYLTLIEQEFAGDTFFPAFDWNDWSVVERVDVTDDSSVPFHYSFWVLENRAIHSFERPQGL